jgi:hypothetical protein
LGASPTFLDAAGQWESQHRGQDLGPGKKTQIYDSSMVPPGPIAPAIRPGTGHRPQTPIPARPQQPAPVAPAPIQPAPVAPIKPAPVAQVQPAPVVHVQPPPAAQAARAAPVQPMAATAHSPQLPPGVGPQPAVVVKAQPEADKGHSVAESAAEPMVSTMRRPLLEGSEEPHAHGAAVPPQGSGIPLPELQHADPRPPPAFGGQTVAVDASVWARPPNVNAPMPQFDAGLGATQNDALDAPPAKKPNAMVAAWRSASLVKKITFFLLPLAFVAVLWPEPPPPPGPAATARGTGSASPTPSGTPVRTGPAASASAAPKASTAPAAGSASAAGKPVASTSPPAASVVAALNSGAANPSAPPAAEGKKSGAAESAAPAASAPSAASAAASASADRLAAQRPAGPAYERSAVDAAFAGKWQDAIRFYDRLAEAHPDDPVFKEAARIIRETKLNPK